MRMNGNRSERILVLDYTADTDLASIKLLACDMDLTLLASDGSQPEGMTERIRALTEHGVVFCPASGRPNATLALMFPEVADEIALCGDNGALISYQGETVYENLIDHTLYHELLNTAAATERCVPVLCALECAYVLERDRPYHDEVYKYYKDIRYVNSFDEVDPESDKVSLLCPAYDSMEQFTEIYDPQFGERLMVTCAGREWIDLMNTGVNKGAGVTRLCEHLGIDLADAAAAGDTHNDIQMLEAVGHSFLVANAADHMHAHAKFQIPSNDDRGVAVLIDAILDAKKH